MNKLTYKERKELSDAGFPNLGIFHHDFIEEPNDDPMKSGWDIKATCKRCGEIRRYASSGMATGDVNEGCSVVSNYREPCLEELIEVCGDKFSSLEKVTGGYIATHHSKMAQVYETPKQAVANLYIALNRKSRSDVL